jgi:hypothetical protein
LFYISQYFKANTFGYNTHQSTPLPGVANTPDTFKHGCGALRAITANPAKPSLCEGFAGFAGKTVQAIAKCTFQRIISELSLPT